MTTRTSTKRVRSSSKRARVSAKQARDRFSTLIDQVRIGGERIVVQRHGRDVAAVVSVLDLQLLELIEDRRDIKEARKALAREDRVSWDTVKAQLELE